MRCGVASAAAGATGAPIVGRGCDPQSTNRDHESSGIRQACPPFSCPSFASLIHICEVTRCHVLCAGFSAHGVRSCICFCRYRCALPHVTHQPPIPVPVPLCAKHILRVQLQGLMEASKGRISDSAPPRADETAKSGWKSGGRVAAEISLVSFSS